MAEMKCANQIGFNPFCDDRLVSNLSSLDYNIDECLKKLEEWILTLVSKTESRSNVSKLSYCYWCVNTLRTEWNTHGQKEQVALNTFVVSMSRQLQKALICYEFIECDALPVCTLPLNQGRHIISPISRRCAPNKRKIRRKCHMRKDWKNSPKTLPPSNQYQLELQLLIDELYTSARTVIAKNCANDEQVLKELNNYIDRTDNAYDKSELPNDNSFKYGGGLWSGDCKINGDNRDGFFDPFYNSVDSADPDNDMDLSSDRSFHRFKKSSIGSHGTRPKRDSDFDEGFSENEFVDDSDHNLLPNSASESRRRECLQYCGDCDYNSSNSKLADNVHTERSMGPRTHSHDLISLNDDGSDSDGGTDILKSVNATVNKFNAIMAHNDNTHTTPSSFIGHIDYVDNSWPNMSDPVQLLLAPVTVAAAYDEDRQESPHCPISALYKPHTSHTPHTPPMTNLASLNNESQSQMILSPINVHSWCSFNANYLPTSSYNFYQKPPKSYEQPTTENYDIQNLTPWFPCLSNTVASHNGGNYRQQPLHQILLTPQLTLPSISLGTMQHNIVQRPHIFQQRQHSPFDTEYIDRRYTPINPKLSSTLNNNNNKTHSCHESCAVSSPPLSIVINTNNHSTTVALCKNHPCQPTVFKACLDKSQRACCFYMRGGCKKEDCEYAHDLSKVTCKFWEKGDCFKADTCPFKHGYQKN